LSDPLVDRSARNTLHALTLMLAATASFVGMQTLVRVARLQGFQTAEVMFMRSALGLPVLWYMVRRRGGGLAAQAPRHVFARSFFGSLAMGLNFASMQSLSLAQFSTLNLSQPVFVALASPLLLHESVGVATWGALLLSFSGAWVMLDPSAEHSAVPLLPALLALGSALASAVAHIWVRISTEKDPPERVVFHFSAWVSAGALLAGLAGSGFRALPEATTAPVALSLLLGLSAFGTLGQLLLTRAYVHAAAAKVSMVSYTSIALGMVVDYAVWNLAPSSGSLLGGVLMLGAGFLLVRRSRTR
jgi:drug/metabolite transporter (DMT)-like permease